VNGSDPKVFGRNVRAFRILRGWSIRDLSKQSGISLQTIVNVEAGKGCAPATEERFARAFQTFVGRLWDVSLLSPERQRVIDSNHGRWFFASVEQAKEYARRQRLADDEDDGRFRADPDAIQEQTERYRLGHTFGWCFARALGGAIAENYYRYNICELFGRDSSPRPNRPFMMLLQAQSGNFRVGIRGEEFEVFQGDSFVFDCADPWWIEPLHQVRPGEKPAIVHIICLDHLSLNKVPTRKPREEKG
jgi:transcriptional regulator with XRE-family HTH domain